WTSKWRRNSRWFSNGHSDNRNFLEWWWCIPDGVSRREMKCVHKRRPETSSSFPGGGIRDETNGEMSADCFTSLLAARYIRHILGATGFARISKGRLPEGARLVL